MTLSHLDLIALVTYLLLVAGVGVFLSRGTHDVADYLLGSRRLPWWAILGSIVATETSTATFLSIPAIAYAEPGDLRYFQLTIGYALGRLIIVGTLLPLYFRGQVFTAYEILHDRSGAAAKSVAAVIFLVTRNLGDGLRLYLAALALQQVLPISLSQCVVMMGSITLFYTFVGGMRAVVWNDCLQMLIYLSGGLVAAFVIQHRLDGGWQEWIDYGRVHDKLRVFDFRWAPSDAYSFWTAVTGGLFLSLGTHGTDQLMVQRYLSAASQRDAGKAIAWSGVVVAAQTAFFLWIGVGLAAFYAAHELDASPQSPDQVFAHFIAHEFPPGFGLVGFVLAAVFAAAMSTLSSSINSSAASALKDLLLPWLKNDHCEPLRQLRYSKWLTVAFGLLQIAIGIGAQRLSDTVVVNALKIAGISAGLLLGIFALAHVQRRTSPRAIFAGILAGISVQMAVAFPLRHWVAWPWYALIGATATFVVGSLWSRFAGNAAGR